MKVKNLRELLEKLENYDDYEVLVSHITFSSMADEDMPVDSVKVRPETKEIIIL